MAVNVAKCTISFTQNNYGWTENYYLNSPSPDLAAEMTALQALAAKRILCSGQNTFVPYLKVSNELTLRDVITYSYGSAQGAPLQGTVPYDSEPPDTALLCNRKSSSNVQTCPLYMRGVWDRLFVGGGNFNFFDTFWIITFSSFKAQLLTGGFGMVTKDPASPARVAVTAVTQLPTGQIGYTLGAALFTVAAGTKVRIFASGIQGAVSANGSQIVVVNSPTSCSTVKRIPTFTYTTGGYVTWNTQVFVPIANIYATRVVERKVGRPLYLSRGRARVRKVS